MSKEATIVENTDKTKGQETEIGVQKKEELSESAIMVVKAYLRLSIKILKGAVAGDYITKQCIHELFDYLPVNLGNIISGLHPKIKKEWDLFVDDFVVLVRLREDLVPNCLEGFIKLLGPKAFPDINHEVTRWLKGKDETLVLTAIRILEAWRKTDLLRDELTRVAEETPKNYLRQEKLIFALSQFPGSLSIGRLTTYCFSRDRQLAFTSLDALARLRGTSADESNSVERILKDVTLNHSDKAVRTYAVNRL